VEEGEHEQPDPSLALLLLQEQALRLEFASSLARQFDLTEAEATEAATHAFGPSRGLTQQGGGGSGVEQEEKEEEALDSDEEREFQAFVSQLLPPAADTTGVQSIAHTVGPCGASSSGASASLSSTPVPPFPPASNPLATHASSSASSSSSSAFSLPSSPLSSVAVRARRTVEEDSDADEEDAAAAAALSPWDGDDRDVTALLHAANHAATPTAAVAIPAARGSAAATAASVPRVSAVLSSSPPLASTLVALSDWRAAISPSLDQQRRMRDHLLREAAQLTATSGSPPRASPSSALPLPRP
jgi:hypothetical protein